jgi:hypothetical protein
MRHVWTDLAMAVFSIAATVVALATDQPITAAINAWIAGGSAVFALADFRDVARHRAGMFRDYPHTP